MISIRLFTLLTAAGVLFTSCDGPTEPTPIASIDVTAPTTTLTSSGSVQLTAVARSSGGRVLVGRSLTWTSSDQAIAIVSATGLVTAGTVLGGTAEPVIITASGEGVSATATLRVAPVEITRLELILDSVKLRVGDSLRLSARLTAVGGVIATGREIQWRSLDTTVARISSDGMVTAISDGGARYRGTRVIATHQLYADTAILVAEPLAPVLQFTASETLVRIGRFATLRWTTRYATGCTGSELVQRAADSAGEIVFRAESGGRRWARLTCTGDGGTTRDSLPINTPFPVATTSYANFKTIGVAPKDIPWGTTYPLNARAYADFAQRGDYGLLTADILYVSNIRDSINPPPALLAFWRLQGATWMPDNEVQVEQRSAMCIHPRKIIVADFNNDERPDAFIACHGYDAGSFPGERNMVLLSNGNARYVLDVAAPDIGFWHGATAADINGDQRPDVLAVTESGKVAVFLNSGEGRFARDIHHSAAMIRGSYFNIELLDVNDDGELDLFLGGHEWGGQGETSIFLGDGSFRFDGARRIIPAVPDIGGVVNDILVTGNATSRTVWILRTSGGGETFYHGVIIQRYDWSTGVSQLALQRSQPIMWVDWLFPFDRENALCIGSDMRVFALELCP